MIASREGIFAPIAAPAFNREISVIKNTNPYIDLAMRRQYFYVTPPFQLQIDLGTMLYILYDASREQRRGKANRYIAYYK